MSATFVEDEQGVPRDRFGRPGIVQADGSLVAYTRASTLAKTLDTGEQLKQWATAMTALGMVIDPDISERVTEIVAAAEKRGVEPYEAFKTELIQLARQAQEAAGSTRRRDLGTTLHGLSQVVDRDGDLTAVPDEHQEDMRAYLWAMAELEVLDAEVFVVVDEIKVAGRLDKLVRLPGETPVYTGDLKTGAWDAKKPMSVTAQVAIYTHGQRYDIRTGERSPLHPDLDLARGLLIHGPAGSKRCNVYPLDLVRGWADVQLALTVREARKVGGRVLKVLERGAA